MDQLSQISQNQATFIPRKAIGRESAVTEKPVSLFLFLAALVFTVSILGAAGVFLYKYVLTKNIETSGVYLNQRKDALEPDTINDLLRTGRRLRIAGTLLDNHVVVTPIFNLLEGLTLKSVRFIKFEYTTSQNNLISVKLSGQAKSYGSVALQADLFGSEKRFVKSVIFSNLNLDDKGNVIFDAILDIDPDLINYKKALAREKAGA